MIDVKGYSLKQETIKAWEKSFLADYEYLFLSKKRLRFTIISQKVPT